MKKTKTSKFGVLKLTSDVAPPVVIEFLSQKVKIVGISSIELTIENIAKGTTDPRVEFILPK